MCGTGISDAYATDLRRWLKPGRLRTLVRDTAHLADSVANRERAVCLRVSLAPPLCTHQSLRNITQYKYSRMRDRPHVDTTRGGVLSRKWNSFFDCARGMYRSRRRSHIFHEWMKSCTISLVSRRREICSSLNNSRFEPSTRLARAAR